MSITRLLYGKRPTPTPEAAAFLANETARAIARNRREMGLAPRKAA